MAENNDPTLCPLKCDAEGSFHPCVENQCAFFLQTFDQNGKRLGGFCSVPGGLAGLRELATSASAIREAVAAITALVTSPQLGPILTGLGLSNLKGN